MVQFEGRRANYRRWTQLARADRGGKEIKSEMQVDGGEVRNASLGQTICTLALR
jgi:hypothetical protein